MSDEDRSHFEERWKNLVRPSEPRECWDGKSLVTDALDKLAEAQMGWVMALDLAAKGCSTVIFRLEPGKPPQIISEEQFYADRPPPRMLVIDEASDIKPRVIEELLKDDPNRFRDLVQQKWSPEPELLRRKHQKPHDPRKHHHHPLPQTPRRFRP